MGGKEIDITNERYGHLIAICKTGKKNKYGNLLWKFRCDCGRECIKIKSSVTSGDTKTCRHKDCKYRKELNPSVRKSMDITNERYGHLIAICKTDKKDNYGHYLWKFKCDCGRECLKRKDFVTRGATRSCKHPECKYRYNKIRGKNI